MSRVVVEATLNTSGVKSGLNDMRRNISAFSKEAGEGLFGRKAIGLLSGGLGAAAAALVVLKVLGAAWNEVTESARRYFEATDAAEKASLAKFADLAAVADAVNSFPKTLAAMAATFASSATDGLRYFKEVELQMALITKRDKEFQQVMAQRAKALVEIEARTSALQASVNTGNSPAERMTRAERERSKILDEIKVKENDSVAVALLKERLVKNTLELEDARKDYAEMITREQEKLNELQVKGAETVAANAQKIADAILDAQEKLSQLQTGRTVASGRLGQGISVAGEEVFSIRDDAMIRKLQAQIDHLSNISQNTEKLSNLEADFRVR